MLYNILYNKCVNAQPVWYVVNGNVERLGGDRINSTMRCSVARGCVN